MTPSLPSRLSTIAEAEAALKAVEERTRLILDHALDAVITIDAAGRITGWNPQAERTFGWLREEALGRTLSETIIPARYQDAHERGLTRYLDTGEERVLNRRIELSAIHRDGREIPIELAITLITTQGEIGFSAFLRDITDRRDAEESLRAREAQYRLLFDSNPNPMWVYDTATLGFLMVNDATLHKYGYSKEEFSRMTIMDIRPPEDVPLLVAELAKPGPDPLTPTIWRHRTKGGTLIEVEVSSQSIIWLNREAELVLANDVTQRKHLEERLRQSQRIDAVGRLAAGIAHDFNNILSGILGYAEILVATLPEGSQNATDALEIRLGAERAAALTRQILAFSRQQVLEERVLDLNMVIGGLDGMLRRIIGEDVELVMRLDPELGRVKSDAGQLEQVIMNLVVNARDAMPRGGRLIIETSNAELDETYEREHVGGSAGYFVMMTVTDSGVGITREQQAHIFEPFYTTKQRGEGTGLGLATVYGIVKQSGGYIWVYSEAGHGATFKVYLPRVDAPLAFSTPEASKASPYQATETILVVEDEESVRRIAHRILVGTGYTVLTASNRQEAVSCCQNHPAPIHLILSDVVMPGGNGFDLAMHLTALRPEARVLFMSGYAGMSIAHLGVLKEGMGFIEKPFTTSALNRKVRELLDVRGAISVEPIPDRPLKNP